MKSDFGKKIVLLIHWLASLAVVIAMTVLFFMGRLPVRPLRADAVVFAIALLIVYLIFAAGALLISFPGFWRWKERNFITISAGGLGRTRISVPAVDQMIRKAMRGIDGVADMKTVINNNNDAIEINVNIVLEAGAHVPTVTASAQRAVRSYIEKNCGIEVSAVIVSVFSVQDDEAPIVKKKAKAPIEAQPTPAVEPVETPTPFFAPEEEEGDTLHPEFDAEETFAVTEEPFDADVTEEAPAEEEVAEEAVEAPTQGLSRSAKKRRRRKKKLAKMNAQNAVEPEAAEAEEPVEESAEEPEAAEATEETEESFAETEESAEEVADDSPVGVEETAEEPVESCAEPEQTEDEFADSYAEPEQSEDEFADSFPEFDEPVEEAAESEPEYPAEDTYVEDYSAEDEEAHKYDDFLTD